MAAAAAWPMVLVGRVVDRFGKGVRSAPRDALIASSVPPQALGRAFGFHRAGDSLGAVIGPLLGLLALSAMDGDVQAALWWAVIPACLSALLVVLVREPKPGRARCPTGRGGAGSGHRQGYGRRPFAAAPAVLARTTVLVGIALVNFSNVLVCCG